jgi:hypothetical protein
VETNNYEMENPEQQTPTDQSSSEKPLLEKINSIASRFIHHIFWIAPIVNFWYGYKEGLVEKKRMFMFQAACLLSVLLAVVLKSLKVFLVNLPKKLGKRNSLIYYSVTLFLMLYFYFGRVRNSGRNNLLTLDNVFSED